jgi:threonine dehydratase
MEGVAVRTPLVEVRQLTETAGVPVHLKLESRQPTGAFKLRGAWTAVRRLAPDQRHRGVITYSSGNHGQAVAFAAQKVGIRAVIVMPETAPPAKVDGVKKWSGEVVFAGTTSEDRFSKAMEIVEQEGLAVIPPFDHPDVIAGQGTVGLEIVEDLPEVTEVVVPVGGGGLAAGVSTAVAALRPQAQVTAVEPETAAAYAAAVDAGKPVRLSVGTLTFSHMRGIARPVTVTDTSIVEATQWLLAEATLEVEPSGAATTAALRSGVVRPVGPVVLVVSGGNIDPKTIPSLSPVS